MFRIYKFLFINYFELSKFMRVRLFPFCDFGFLWQIEQTVPYHICTDRQKILSSALWRLMRQADGIK